MKILIIGGSGVIGTKLLNFFVVNNWDVEFTYLTHKVPYAKGHKLDITKKEDVIKLISEINPNVVVNTTSLLIDKSENNPELAESINVKGMENIIEGCKKINSKIVYVSTSAVFDGTKSEYFETDPPSPSTNYGLTKYKAEELIKKSGLSYLILRTDALYCWIEDWQKPQRINSVLRVLDTLGSGKILKEITDWINTPTYVPDFVYATHKLLEQKEEGIFHISGPEFINRYDWSLQVAKIFGLDKKMIHPITADELKLPAKRANIKLCNQKLIEKTGFRMNGVQEGLLKMLRYDRP